MGLDQYLYRKHYVGNKWEKLKKNQIKIKDPKNELAGLKNERISEITEDVAYWRKANAIHQWFVKNVQDGEDDCKEYYVSREQITELRDACRQIIAGSKLVTGKIKNGERLEGGQWKPIMEPGKYIKDPTLAQQILPCQSGFFFGSTDYDQWYFDDLKYTEKTLTELLEEKTSGEFYYSSSW